LLILAIALSLVQPAHALEVEAGAGTCKATRQPDGMLWQSEFPHEISTTSGCWHIGLTGRFRDSSFGWSTFYSDLGKWTVNDVFKGPDEVRFVQGQGILVHYIGEGSAYGFGAGITHTRNMGEAQVRPELGLFVYRYKWAWTASFQTGENFAGENSSSGRVTPYLGLQVKWRDLFVSAKYYTDISAKGFEGIANGPLVQYTAGASIPF
jgi:hypothetical protein